MFHGVESDEKIRMQIFDRYYHVCPRGAVSAPNYKCIQKSVDETEKREGASLKNMFATLF